MALIRAVMRLLWRFALFLWICPVFTALSIAEENAAAAAAAGALLPAVIAARTFLSSVFMREVTRLFCRVRRSVWRARLAADLVLAMLVGSGSLEKGAGA